MNDCGVKRVRQHSVSFLVCDPNLPARREIQYPTFVVFASGI
jgi:hypothetical protein